MLVAQAWDLNINSDADTLESCNGEPLFHLKLSGTSSVATSVCCIAQVASCRVPGPTKKSYRRRTGGQVESRRFCVSNREGKIWVIEWSLHDLNCCNEVNCLDLQKQMRFKSEHKSMSGVATVGQEQPPHAGGGSEHTAYKLDGVATALTAPSAATAAVRVESVFSVLSLCAAAAVSSQAAVFIMTTNGVLISVDVEVSAAVFFIELL